MMIWTMISKVREGGKPDDNKRRIVKRDKSDRESDY